MIIKSRNALLQFSIQRKFAARNFIGKFIISTMCWMHYRWHNVWLSLISDCIFLFKTSNVSVHIQIFIYIGQHHINRLQNWNVYKCQNFQTHCECPLLLPQSYQLSITVTPANSQMFKKKIILFLSQTLNKKKSFSFHKVTILSFRRLILVSIKAWKIANFIPSHLLFY